jgi:hypothetical protein
MATEGELAVELQVDGIGYEYIMGDQIDQPIEVCDEKEMQQIMMQNQNQPMK